MTSGRKPKNQNNLELTDLELEIMNIMWKRNESSVREVCDELNEKKKLAYTTVATVFKILEKKKYLASQKVGNVLSYKTAIEKDTYQNWFLSNQMKNVFENPQGLVAKLIDETDLSAKEIEKIKKALANKEF